MRSVAVSLVIVGVVIGGVLRAQSPKRLPVIAGNGLVHVLVGVDGSVKTWGSPGSMDPSPSLGDGVKPQDTKPVTAPRLLSGVHDIVDAGVGVSHVLLLTRDGAVLAWGDNDSCELGNGSDRRSLAPIPVPGLRGVKQIAVSDFVSAAVLADGTVWVWGEWQRPCLNVPTKVEGIDDVERLAIDGASALAIKRDGTVWGWGDNSAGALCDGTTARHPRPVQVNGITNAVDVAKDGNSVVVLADGTVRMCGSNLDGALGDPSPNVKQHLTPFRVPGLTGVRSARTRGNTTIVQLTDGTLRAWGNGYYGALGDGHGDSGSVKPRAPIGLGPVLAHYMSGNTSYAIRADGTVMVWCLPAPPGGKTEFVLTPTPGFTIPLSE